MRTCSATTATAASTGTPPGCCAPRTGRPSSRSSARTAAPDGRPPGIFHDRGRVAAPYYVLSHSFLKFLVDRLGVQVVAGLLDTEDVAAALLARSGRTVEALKADWLARIHGARRSAADGDQPARGSE